MNPLVYWAVEREAIRKKREAGQPWPWTDDPILQTYRFTNVRRQDDRVSRWLIRSVLREEYIKSDLDSFLAFSAFCRWVNWPPTIKLLMAHGCWPAKKLDWRKIGDLVDKCQRSGVKAWTGAYMVRAKPGDARGKGRFVAEDVIKRSLVPKLPQVRLAITSASREAVWEVLVGCLNWGSFMSGQVVADWGYTSLLQNAADTQTWAPQGPGSLRGFNRVLGLPLNTRHSREEWLTQLQQWREEVVQALGPAYKDLELHAVQNLCCEVDKWLRVKNGEGRPRAKFVSETGY